MEWSFSSSCAVWTWREWKIYLDSVLSVRFESLYAIAVNTTLIQDYL